MAPFSPKTEFVPWGVWVWSVSVVSICLMALFGFVRSVQGEVAKVKEQNQSISVQLSQIQADLKNIDARLVEIRQDFKNHIE